MEATKAPLEGLLILTPRVFRDERGFFFESYNQRLFSELGISLEWRQDNHVLSVARTTRGMHFQHDPGQAKLVRCVRGRIWDVAVDIRPDSPTLGRWFGLELDAQACRMLFVPVGFAHGYCVLGEEQAEVIYKCSDIYQPALEDGFRWDDPQVGIDWPVADPILSERDRASGSFADCMARLRAKSMSGKAVAQ